MRGMMYFLILTLVLAVSLAVDGVKAVPNPVSDAEIVHFIAKGVGIKDVQVQIYDLSGREVFASGWVAGQTFEWNLMGDRGQLVANGVYLYIVAVRGFSENKLVQSKVKKLVVLR